MTDDTTQADEIVQRCIDGEQDPAELPAGVPYAIYLTLSPNPSEATHKEVTEFQDRMAESGIWELVKPPEDFQVDGDELADELEDDFRFKQK